MKEQYEKLTLTVTHFDSDDVIATSEIDRNNAYRALDSLSSSSTREAPAPGSWI